MGERSRAGAAVSTDADPRRAGMLAAAESASEPGRESVRSLVLFASGRHASAAGSVAEGAAERFPDATIIVAGGAGVIAPQGEIDAGSSVAALALDVEIRASVEPAPDEPDAARAAGRALGEAVQHRPSRPVLFFSAPSPLTGPLLDSMYEVGCPAVVAGGGLAVDGQVAVYEPGAAVRTGGVGAARLDGGLRLAVGASPAVVPLSEWATVDRVEDGFVAELGGRPPLNLLNDAVRNRNDRPLVLAAIAPASGEGAFLVRGIAGVNPSQGSVFLGTGISEGDRVAFAALDADAARRGFDTMLGELRRGLCGGVPLAGFFMDCAGRGASLYGRPGVDARAIRSRFPGLPFVGMRSSFEIAPFDDRPAIHSYTGVVAFLYAPS